MSNDSAPLEEPGKNPLLLIGGAALGVLLGAFVVVVLILQSFGSNQACNPGALTIDPASVPEGPVAGYGHEQLVNAAIIAKVAADRQLPAKAQLIGIMTSMGESTLNNIDYGDDLYGVTNPDGSLTCSLGLFQQQWCIGWGTKEEVMDPVYAAGAFFDRLVTVEAWESMAPTIAINTVQGNADPQYYAQFETDANEILTAIAGAKSSVGGGGCGASGEWVPTIDMATPGLMLTDFYGTRDASINGSVYLHAGIDFSAATGTPILAVADGTVTDAVAVDNGGWGISVSVEHADGTVTNYLHLSQVLVQVGQTVTAGQPVGALGNSGSSTGPHLDFRMTVGGEYVDPIPFMQARGVDYCTLPVGGGLTTSNTCA